ncbi:MAG TPA: tetratricopeptide repeat protein [Bryobacteraceae bacterium]|nr:tetratricopeptide repeat protein [Bryobacteraceae bacterium]
MKITSILFLATVALSAQNQSPDRLMNALQDRALAQQAMRLKTDERITMYQTIVKAQPEVLHYQVLLASAYLQKMRETTDFGYVDRASKILEAVLAADNDNYEALRLRTEVALERHEFPKAADYSRQLTKIAPNDPWNWGTLADALTEWGDYDGAADAMQKMINLRPDLSSYNRAAHYRFLFNDVPGAVDLMKRAIESGSPSSENVAWCMVELGGYYLKTGQVDQAERTYTAASRTFPGFHPAYAGLGKAQMAKGDYKAAIASFTRAQSITPMPDYAAALQQLYKLTGDEKSASRQSAMIDAIDTLSKANGEKANRNLAMIFLDQDRKLDRGLELAKGELEFRRDVYTYDTLAWALYKNKHYDEAAEAIGKALKLGTPEPMFYFHAGMIETALGKKDEAAAHLRHALALNPKFDIHEASMAEEVLKGAE